MRYLVEQWLIPLGIVGIITLYGVWFVQLLLKGYGG